MDIRKQVAAALDGGPRWASDAFAPEQLAHVDDEVAFVVATSGSTGTPKGVLLTAEAVRASAAATRDRIGDGAWALAVPVQFVAGLMVVARAVLSDRPLVPVSPDLHDLSPTEPTHISLVPTQLVRALRSPDVTARLADCRSILLGGAAASPDLLARARDAGLTLHTTYGMSETSGGCVYDHTPLPGVTVEVDDEDRITLGGPMMFSGYLNDPARTAAVLGTRDGIRTVRTQDRGIWREGRLTVVGRVDDVVKCGGVKVDLAAVTRAAAALSGDHVAFGVEDAEWGTRVVLASTSATLTDARGLDLPSTSLPKGVVRVDSLPVTDRGKIDLRALRRMWHAGTNVEVY